MDGSTRTLRKFGVTVGGIFALIGAYVLYRAGMNSLAGRILCGGGLLLVLFGLFLPGTLGLVHRGWMAFAQVLGWVNARIILGVVFYGIFTPVRGLLMILRKDPMKRRPDPSLASYWIEVENGEATPASLEHPF